MGAEVFRAGGQLDMTKPVFVFWNFANMPRNTVLKVTVHLFHIRINSFLVVIFQCQGSLHHKHVQGLLGIINICHSHLFSFGQQV